MDAYQRLEDAIFEAGVAVEQLGPVDGVCFAIEEDEVVLRLGEEGEERFDELDEALQRVVEYGDEIGGDGRRRGAIVELTERLEELVARLPRAKRCASLCRQEREVDRLVARYGFTELDLDDSAAEGEVLRSLEDGNGALWLVTVAEGRVCYQPATLPDED